LAPLIGIEWVLVMKKIRRRNKPYISPLRLRKQRQAQRAFLMYLSLCFLGFGVGSLLAGLINRDFPELFRYLADIKAAFSVGSTASGLLKTVAQSAVICGGFYLCGTSLFGAVAAPLLLASAAGSMGLEAGIMLRSLGVKESVSVSMVLLVPHIAKTALLVFFAKRAARNSKALRSSVGGENSKTAVQQFSLYSALQTVSLMLLGAVEYLLRSVF